MVACVAEAKSGLIEAHERLGHLNERNLKQMAERGTVLGLKLLKDEDLETCELHHADVSE